MVVLAVGVRYWVKRVAQDARRARLRKEPFPAEWVEILERNVGLYPRLPEALKEELHGHTQVFLAEKNFEGCGGLELTDEIRVTVAAQACMLLLNRKARFYPRLKSILIYPDAYVTKRYTPMGGGHVEGEGVNLGESWGTGAVVLSWKSAKHGAWNVKDGNNVVFHEFAHQLDQEDGAADGAPILERRSSYAAWGRVLSAEYKELRKRRGKKVMNRYGATNPAEFFAVLTETFFEKAWQLEKKHPELYEQAKAYYQVDPVNWGSGGSD